MGESGGFRCVVKHMSIDFALLPGGDLVERGLSDLSFGRCTEEALLVLIAGPRLRELGVSVPENDAPRPREHALYAMIEARDPGGAHATYNALVERIVSFANACDAIHDGLHHAQSREALS